MKTSGILSLFALAASTVSAIPLAPSSTGIDSLPFDQSSIQNLVDSLLSIINNGDSSADTDLASQIVDALEAAGTSDGGPATGDAAGLSSLQDLLEPLLNSVPNGGSAGATDTDPLSQVLAALQLQNIGTGATPAAKRQAGFESLLSQLSSFANANGSPTGADQISQIISMIQNSDMNELDGEDSLEELLDQLLSAFESGDDATSTDLVSKVLAFLKDLIPSDFNTDRPEGIQARQSPIEDLAQQLFDAAANQDSTAANDLLSQLTDTVQQNATDPTESDDDSQLDSLNDLLEELAAALEALLDSLLGGVSKRQPGNPIDLEAVETALDALLQALGLPLLFSQIATE
ncbi:hypothetical protein Slin15195_G080350 [Septoria linicola]|uniref:Uncharacterized protein n=1 Tax=Septoria linicola TaxID=215465 RepID=A0A9Q9B1N2_9PEZI|nr:hypothetical protein Slin14017_G041530 [Septoria linicola]USW54716.1 hypothetical protein Slin15195_G080350 [Septoria linicola]